MSTITYHARCERRRLQQLKSKSTSATTASTATTESRAQHQQQSVSLATSSAACVLSTNSRDVNASAEEHPIVGVSSSSRCITVSADVHRPMSASQILSDSVPNVVQPEGMQPGSFLVHPPFVFMQQGLTAGSVSFSPVLHVYSNSQITAHRFLYRLHLS